MKVYCGSHIGIVGGYAQGEFPEVETVKEMKSLLVEQFKQGKLPLINNMAYDEDEKYHWHVIEKHDDTKRYQYCDEYSKVAFEWEKVGGKDEL